MRRKIRRRTLRRRVRMKIRLDGSAESLGTRKGYDNGFLISFPRHKRVLFLSVYLSDSRRRGFKCIHSYYLPVIATAREDVLQQEYGLVFHLRNPSEVRHATGMLCVRRKEECGVSFRIEEKERENTPRQYRCVITSCYLFVLPFPFQVGAQKHYSLEKNKLIPQTSPPYLLRL